MGTHIRHIRSPEAPPRRRDHPTFGDEVGSRLDQRLAALKARWARLRAKTAPLVERLVRKVQYSN